MVLCVRDIFYSCSAVLYVGYCFVVLCNVMCYWCGVLVVLLLCYGFSVSDCVVVSVVMYVCCIVLVCYCVFTCVIKCCVMCVIV